MEKDALLDIIAHDLKEVESLIQSFKGKSTISQPYFRLTRKRIDSILEELEMLEELNSGSDNKAEISEKTKAEILEKTEIVKDKIQKQPRQEENKKTETEMAKSGDKHTREEDASPESSQKDPGTAPVETHSKPNHSNEKTTDNPEKVKDDTTLTPDISTGNKPAQPASIQENKSDKPVNNHSRNPSSNNQTIDNKTETSSSKKGPAILGDKLKSGNASYNEHFAKNSTKNPAKRSFTSPPISDLKKALGLNDRFFYQRELFGENADLMNQTLNQLNQMNGFEDARNFLFANFNWDQEEEAVVSFLNLIQRRFL